MAVTTFSFVAFFTTLLLSSPVISTVHSIYPAIFNFGDSNSDTGCVIAAGIGALLDPPYGQTYFHEPSGRFSDGRLIIDFLSHAMDKRFLNAYLESVGVPNFRKGANFAAAGSTILPLHSGKLDKFVPREEHFRKGLYTFDIGQNDLAGAFYSKTVDQVIASIPTILQEFENGTKKLYDQGARNFWIHNTGPLGCLPQNLFMFGKEKSDKHACLRPHNHAARVFNLQLLELCRKLQREFADARITYVDIFSIKFDLISNFSRYGFEHPTTACCGYGGPPLNYDSRISCGQTKVLNGTSVTAKGCDDFTKYVSWDGIHYTEAANHHVWSQILTGKYSYPLFSDKI